MSARRHVECAISLTRCDRKKLLDSILGRDSGIPAGKVRLDDLLTAMSHRYPPPDPKKHS